MYAVLEIFEYLHVISFANKLDKTLHTKLAYHH